MLRFLWPYCTIACCILLFNFFLLFLPHKHMFQSHVQIFMVLPNSHLLNSHAQIFYGPTEQPPATFSCSDFYGPTVQPPATFSCSDFYSPTEQPPATFSCSDFWWPYRTATCYILMLRFLWPYRTARCYILMFRFLWPYRTATCYILMLRFFMARPNFYLLYSHVQIFYGPTELSPATFSCSGFLWPDRTCTCYILVFRFLMALPNYHLWLWENVTPWPLSLWGHRQTLYCSGSIHQEPERALDSTQPLFRKTVSVIFWNHYLFHFHFHGFERPRQQLCYVVDGAQDWCLKFYLLPHRAAIPWLMSQLVSLCWQRSSQWRSGTRSGNRTHDFMTRSQVFYRLSYREQPSAPKHKK